jgi:hypothetical protein
MKRTCLAATVVIALVACKKESAKHDARALDLPPTRASQIGDFPDNPLLAHIPADTPYALATFKPVPVDYIEKMGAMFKPMFRQAEQIGGDGAEKLRALADEIGTFSVQRFEELGFSAKARMVVYGLGLFPVFRIEIGDGGKVLALVERVATKWGVTLPPPTEEGGRKVWRIDNNDLGVMIVLGKTELAAAFAPASSLDKLRGLIVGTEMPASSIGIAKFKDIAKRDGYNAQAVGFLDSVQLVTTGLAFAGDAGRPPACKPALEALAGRAPQLTMGYDDFSSKRLSFGVVLHLAPDLLGEVKKLQTSLAGVDRMLADKPMLGLALAADVAQARALGNRAATVLADVGTACEIGEIGRMSDGLASAASKPLPPPLEGVRGAIASLKKLQFGAGGPQNIEGWGVLRVANTTGLVDMAKQQLPGFELAADRKPRAFPAQLGFPGHIAASQDAIAVATGPGSDRVAGDVLGGTAGTAPLMLMRYDYAQMSDLLASVDPVSGPMLRDIYKAFGVATMQVTADDRGLVMWAVVEMK